MWHLVTKQFKCGVYSKKVQRSRKFQFFFVLCTFSKFTTFFILLAAFSFIHTQGNVIKDIADDAIYALIESDLKSNNPGEEKKVYCIVDDLRRQHIADKFYTSDVILNPKKIQRDIQPYVDVANIKCTIIVFVQSPLGAAVLISLIFLILLSIICSLIRRICCWIQLRHVAL